MVKTVKYRADIERKRTQLPDSERPKRVPRYVPEARIFPGCCSPYPDANYNQRSGHDHTPAVYMHHIGAECAGHLEPVDFNTWYYGPRRVR